MGIQYFRLGYGPFYDIVIETPETGYDHEVVVMFPALSKGGVYNVDGNKMLSFKAKAVLPRPGRTAHRAQLRPN